jgi:splicing factor U2AF 65 kDa subunit
MNMQQTRHARRLYVGGIPNTSGEQDIAQYFRDILKRSLSPSESDGRDPVVSVYLNREKCFAFVELTSIELTSACCQLDGLQFKGNSLRIRRPNDFIPEQMPRDLKPTPVLNLGALGVISTTVADGPNKVRFPHSIMHHEHTRITPLHELRSSHFIIPTHSPVSAYMSLRAIIFRDRCCLFRCLWVDSPMT